MSARFFDRLDRLDEAVARGAGHCDYDRDVAPYLQESASEVYFFSKIEGPEWLPWLIEHQVIRDPDEPRLGDDGIIRPPPTWAPGLYLSKVAGQEPERVAIELVARASTRNGGVRRRMLNIVQDIPASDAERLAACVHEWLAEPVPHLGIPVADYIVHLARGGCVDTALLVARRVLRVYEDGADQSVPKLFRSPSLLVDRWEYGEIVEKVLEIVDVAGAALVDLLATTVEEFLSASGRGEDDYSTIWMPSFHADIQQHGDVREILVKALFDAAGRAVESGQTPLGECLELLSRRSFGVFSRIAYLLLLEGSPTEGELGRWLSDEAVFNAWDLDPPEYWTLIGSRFGDVGPDARDRILGWLREGPPASENRELVSRYGKRWRRERLSALREHLPPDLASELAELEAARASDPVDRATEAAEVVSATPELVPQGLAPMEALSLYLAKDQDGSETVWSDAFRGAAIENPGLYASASIEFSSAGPDAIEGVLSGLRVAYGSGAIEDLDPVLGLAREVVRRFRDPEWGPAGRAVASLLREAVRARLVGSELVGEVSTLLVPLVLQGEPDSDSPSVEPFTLAINRADGEAVIALVGLGMVLVRDKSRSEADLARYRQQLRRALDGRLHEDDGSRAVRAAVGQQFPWLHAVDPEWAEENVELVFPPGEDRRAAFSSAWESYMVYTGAYDDTLPVLLPTYRLAVARLTEPIESDRERRDVRNRLGEHLMSYLWRGKLDLRPGGLVADFFDAAPADVSTHAIEFIGRSLSASADELDDAVVERLKDLWEHRLYSARQRRAPSPDLRGFASWLRADRLPAAWALRRFYLGLTLSERTNVSYGLVNALAEHAETCTTETLLVLTALVGRADYWDMGAWPETVEAAVKASSSDGSQNRTLALELLDSLGRHGHVYPYRELANEVKATLLEGPL